MRGSEDLQAYGEHGTLQTEPVRIQLKDNAQPYAVPTTWHVPHLMLQNLNKEQERMEKNGILERAIQPTEWCLPMVPVWKEKTGKACICVDLKRMNKAGKR